ncbi:MAG: ATP-dependent protease subunit HslV [bacterium]|nr:ATP-dependent protease subunit HslV [bacterium]
MNPMHSTTVIQVRRDDQVVMASDGQVTLQETIIKSTASKVKRVGRGDVLVGFAGSAADGLALYTRFEAKLDEFQGNLERSVIELAKDWRTDRVLRQLQAFMIIAGRRQSFLMSGTGDLLQPDEDGVLAIGSGANFAIAAARALMRHTDLSPRAIVEEAMKIAAESCVYTNDHLTIEEL